MGFKLSFHGVTAQTEVTFKRRVVDRHRVTGQEAQGSLAALCVTPAIHVCPAKAVKGRRHIAILPMLRVGFVVASSTGIEVQHTTVRYNLFVKGRCLDIDDLRSCQVLANNLEADIASRIILCHPFLGGPIHLKRESFVQEAILVINVQTDISCLKEGVVYHVGEDQRRSLLHFGRPLVLHHQDCLGCRGGRVVQHTNLQCVALDRVDQTVRNFRIDMQDVCAICLIRDGHRTGDARGRNRFRQDLASVHQKVNSLDTWTIYRVSDGLNALVQTKLRIVACNGQRQQCHRVAQNSGTTLGVLYFNFNVIPVRRKIRGDSNLVVALFNGDRGNLAAIHSYSANTGAVIKAILVD